MSNPFVVSWSNRSEGVLQIMAYTPGRPVPDSMRGRKDLIRCSIDRIAIYRGIIMTCFQYPHFRNAIILGCLLVLSTGYATASQFEPPKLDGFNLHAESDADGDGDGKNETHVKQYFNASGDSIVSMTTRGRLWAWSLNTRENDSAVRNYVIRDSNCDGVFDEVYGLDDEFHVPDCLK